MMLERPVDPESAIEAAEKKKAMEGGKKKR